MPRPSTTRTVYLPCDPATAAAFRRAGELEQSGGTSVDAAYARDRGLDLAVPDDEEEADFWALTDAAVMALGLRPDGPRFVLAARVRPDQLRTDGPEGSGVVVVDNVTWSQVSAIFVDEDSAQPAIDSARAGLGDPDRFAEAVRTLIAEHDLLWYAPDELDGLLDPGE